MAVSTAKASLHALCEAKMTECKQLSIFGLPGILTLPGYCSNYAWLRDEFVDAFAPCLSLGCNEAGTCGSALLDGMGCQR